METDAGRGQSRKHKEKDHGKQKRRPSHFQTVRVGGFEETQMICYLWDLAKTMSLAGQDEGSGREKLAEMEKQLRGRVRVEMRRYFLRRKRRNTCLLLGGGILAAAVMLLFTFLIGVDRVSGNSMYPYLNDGDWVLYTRTGAEIRRDEVIVFKKQGESMVKRVAGLPGDTVEISPWGSRVVVNGEDVREPYAAQPETFPGGKEMGKEQEEPVGSPMTVLDGQYLVLGDNREVSVDSRDSQIGTISDQEILGRMLLVVRVRRS